MAHSIKRQQNGRASLRFPGLPTPLSQTGDYPTSTRAQPGDVLPRFTGKESKLLLGSSEFYGMNSDPTFFTKHKTTPPDVNDHKDNMEIHEENNNGVQRGEESNTEWPPATPWGLKELLNWMYKRTRCQSS